MKSNIELLLKQLKTEKAAKGEVAGKFKHTDKTSAEYPILLTAMKEVSARINITEAKQKEYAESTPPNNSTVSQEISVENSSPFFLINTANTWSKPFTFRLLQENEFSRWDDYLSLHTASYHYSTWLQLIKKSFDHESAILVAMNDGIILGGLPLTFFSSKLFGNFAVSVPFLNYGGVVTHYFDVATALISEAQNLCKERKLSHIEIRTMQAGLEKNARDKKVSMVLRLPALEAQLEKELGTKVRAQCKKAEAYMPSFALGKLDLLDDFYNVFARNMRDLGTPVYSKSWFSNILSSSAITSAIIVIYMAGKPVSTGFLIGNDTMLEIPWASTIQSANIKNANMWMYRQILSYAIAEGYLYFDFGRSTMGAGTYKFKKQWGAKPYQHYWYYLMADNQKMPELNPDNPKYKLFIFMWKLMPVWLTKIIGPPLIKQIP